jgi:hypothetical protein
VRVEARLTESAPDTLAFDMPVELTIVPFYVDEGGDEIMTFAFAPCERTPNDRGATRE